jgi:hypothetical protein
MDVASKWPRDKQMAKLDRDEYILFWLASALGDEVPTGSSSHLMGTETEPEAAVIDPESSRGYIIRDWFGPFLLGPSSRYLRGRC